MPTRFPILAGCTLLAAGLAFVSTGFAKMEQWSDAKGQSFKAEPAEILGPLALFRLPNKSSKLVPLSQLSAEDCVRFAKQVGALAKPAADWSQSHTDIGSDIYGCAMRVAGDRLKEVDLKGQPEPRFYVLAFVSNGEGNSWGMLGKSNWQFQELQRTHPGQIEGFMFGLKHSSTDQAKMATQMKVPYLVAYLDDESRMSGIANLIPSWGYGMVVCNVNGVPLFLSKCDTDESVKAFFTQFTGLLDLIRPDNPTGWADCLHYWKAVQPALHAGDQCEPLLVGDPLNARKLAELGVQQFEATLTISTEGAVTAVVMAPGAVCPDELVAPVSDALKQARIVPAVDHGRFVAGTYRYRFGAKP